MQCRCRSWSVEVWGEALVIIGCSNSRSVSARKHSTPLHVCMFIMQSTATSSECAETLTSVSVAVFSHQQSVSSRPSTQLYCPLHQKVHIMNQLSQQKCFSPVYPVQGWSVCTGATKHTINSNAITWNSMASQASHSQCGQYGREKVSVRPVECQSPNYVIFCHDPDRRKSTYHQLSPMEIMCIRTMSTIYWMTTIYYKLQTNIQE